MEFLIGVLCLIVCAWYVWGNGDDNDPTDVGEPVDYSTLISS